MLKDSCFHRPSGDRANTSNRWLPSLGSHRLRIKRLGARLQPAVTGQFQSGKYSSALIGKLTWTPTWLSIFPSCTWYA